jgi:hypothetical protein
MKPYVDVAIVGSNTLGKPVGQVAFDLSGCEDRLRLIAFKTVNALGQGDYYDGLAPTMPGSACAADDTLDAPLGSVDDNLTHEALYWLANGSCRTLMTTGATGAALKPAFERAGPYPRPLAPTPAEHWLPGIQ